MGDEYASRTVNAESIIYSRKNTNRMWWQLAIRVANTEFSLTASTIIEDIADEPTFNGYFQPTPARRDCIFVPDVERNGSEIARIEPNNALRLRILKE